MPANMKKAGMKYQGGGTIRKVKGMMEGRMGTKTPTKRKIKKMAKEGKLGKGLATKKYGHGGGPKASSYVGNPMGYYNDKAMYGKEQMSKMQIGGTVSKPEDRKPSGTVSKPSGTVSKPKAKRRTVSVTTKNPRPGTVGGSPVTTKTVTKRRGDKTITKTKSVRNPIGPFKSTVSKSKTVSKAGPKGPMGMSQKRTVKSKGSNKQVSQKRGRKMQSRMKKKG